LNQGTPAFVGAEAIISLLFVYPAAARFFRLFGGLVTVSSRALLPAGSVS
jgi:hypothetical protein